MKNNFSASSISANAFLASIVESSDDAIISEDLEGNITSWNPGAEHIFGYTAEEMIGAHVSMLVPPELLSEENDIRDQILNGQNISHFETKRLRKDGSLIDTSISISPIKNDAEIIVGASKIARDITRLRDVDRISAYFEALVESSDDAIISKNLNGYITSWNKAAQRIFGYTAEEAVGNHITLLIPADRRAEEDNILTTLRNGARVDHFETMRRHKEGHLINVSLTVSPIKDRNGKIIGASKISRDITDRLKVEKALLEANHKKDEFLANMSHELRTPMNAVIGLTNILKDMNGMPDKALKFIDTLKLSADNMMDLVNDLLDFAKIEAQALELESIDFSLSEQVRNAARVASVNAQAKGLALSVRIEPLAEARFLGDPLRLHQVIANLLSNAVKFTEAGGIDVHVDGEPRTGGMTDISIQIKDTGVGILAEKLDVIFDKFTQADSSITRRFGGSGLGLSISKAIVEQMGGTIAVQSNVGEGATFTVRLTLKNAQSGFIAPHFWTGTAPDAPPGQRSILLVEDYEPNIIVASTILEKLGLKYDIARNGEEAVAATGRRNYAVILMDVQMPTMDGVEATKRIRAAEADKGPERTPIIAVTAHVREQDQSLYRESGMDDFLPKPFDPDVLARKIQRFVK